MTDHGTRRRSVAPPYSLTARIYDQIYAGKDYAKEARQIRAWVREYGPPRARTLLDVACGSGGHLAYLAPSFEATGLDLNEGMLRVARKRLPRVRFVRGRMQSFRLAERFDVITCLFSAIGYVGGRRELRQTFRTFARHLNPGGLLVVEPWLRPGVYSAGAVHLQTFGTPRYPIVRMNSSERRGDRSIMDMHHLVATPRGIRHWVERHDMGLYDVATYLAALRSAGLRPRYRAHGLVTRRGVYLAVRPAHPPATRGRPSSRRRRGS